MSDSNEILIVGAGPTGLVLALWLTRMGVPVRIIDKADAPGTTSRAFAVQSRTLELYRQIPGLADDVLRLGQTVEKLNLQSHGKLVAAAPLGRFGDGLTPYPGIHIFPQDEHERLLIAYLEKEGVKVERGAELQSFTDNGGTVTATIKKSDGTTDTRAYAYLAGCDGAHSTVRHGLDMGFKGGTYDQYFYVADVEAKGRAAGDEPFFCLEDKDFCLVFPMRHTTATRLVGVVPASVKKEREDITFDDIRAHVEGITGLTINKTNWFSTYHVHHRVADSFSRGRVFLLGDAAHIHSPAGGQGMNTGIGDAVNLAWKFNAVVSGEAPESILATYNAERRAFAEKLVSTTDQLFKGVTNPGLSGKFVRGQVIPKIFPLALKIPFIGKFLFRTISQLSLDYHGSALSAGKAGTVRGGDRLPWVKDSGNFVPLQKHEWQLHVYGTPSAALTAFAAEKSLPLHALPWSKAAGEAGLKKDAAYLVRPDGYVAAATPRQDVAKFRDYLAKTGIKPGRRSLTSP